MDMAELNMAVMSQQSQQPGCGRYTAKATRTFPCLLSSAKQTLLEGQDCRNPCGSRASSGLRTPPHCDCHPPCRSGKEGESRRSIFPKHSHHHDNKLCIHGRMPVRVIWKSRSEEFPLASPLLKQQDPALSLSPPPP